MKIAIRFGDNDFSNTFHGVLATIHDAYKWNDKIPTKEQLCKIINEMVYGHYLLYQNMFEYNDEKSGEICEGTKKYLQQIKPERILINEEVDQYLKNTKWDNSETFILDTDLDYPGCNPIYSR